MERERGILSRPITRRTAIGIMAASIAACASESKPTPSPEITLTPELTRTPRKTKKPTPQPTPTPKPTPEPTEPFERNVEGLAYPGDVIWDDTTLIPEGIVCIDIDDVIYADKNLRTLQITDEYGDKAPINFFPNSVYFDQYHLANQEILRDIDSREIHAIENHTHSHSFLTRLPSDRVKVQMERQQIRLSEVLGHNLEQYFLKPPFIDLYANGIVDPDITQAARDLGLVIILAGIDPRGYDMVGSTINFEDQKQRILNRVKRGIKADAALGRGSHITLHSNENDVESLPQIIDFILGEGYTIKTLRDAIPLARKDARVAIPTPTPKIIFESPTPSWSA